MSTLQPLKVAAAQPAITPGDLAATVAAHVQAIRESHSRLVVFPELSLTGYELDAPDIDPADEALLPLVDACRDVDAVALVGAPGTFRAARRIEVLRVDATGVHPCYAKMCLGRAEADSFVDGPGPGVTLVDGWRVGLGQCKDTRISEHLIATREEGVDLYAAGLVHAPDELHEFEQRAQRITRKLRVPVVFAGYAGNAGAFGPTCGGSGIWAADGTLLTQVGPEPGSIARATVEPGSQLPVEDTQVIPVIRERG